MTDAERDALDARPELGPGADLAAFDGGLGRGRLRVYLGMAPGVGKTYRMLEEGHRRMARGTDLVVGFVEAHGRPNTIRLLDGLEVVPRRRSDYRGVVVEEMDTDGVVSRRPTVALVDELAHTNLPGSARAKRWEDVDRIRDAGIHVVTTLDVDRIRDTGIHVVTTLNVQHLESVADAVETITGAPVHERLPDEVLLGADEIELVDMSPYALRQRMRHGNVYPPDRTEIALDRFFTEGNLTALREIALRIAAHRVEDQLEATSAIGQLPLVTERVLVLVDASPAAPRAVRRAAQLAAVLRGSLVGVVVETPASAGRSFDAARDLQQAIDDAVDLGAEVLRIEADDLAAGLERAARMKGATHLVLPHVSPSGIRSRLERPVTDRILRSLPDLEVHLVESGTRR
jgi:two-component system, OmpR family, sensor histidine kinase KdpD